MTIPFSFGIALLQQLFVYRTKLEIDPDDPEMGRGNRKRKKRKFFDDEHDFNGYKHMNGAAAAGLQSPKAACLESIILKSNQETFEKSDQT